MQSNQSGNARSLSGHLKFVSLETLYSTSFPDPEWLVEDLIPKNACIAFSGQPESFKSFVAQVLGIAVSQGERVFETFKTKQTRVLIIDLENHGQLVQERMQLLGAPKTKNLLFCFDPEFSLEKKENVNEVVDVIKTYDVGLVILDSLIRMHQSQEDSSVEMAKVTKQIKCFVEAGASVIFIHHDRKGDVNSQDAQSMRGSSEIRAAVDMQYGFKAKDGIVTVQQLKNRLRPKSDPFNLTTVQDGELLRFVYQGKVPAELKDDSDIELVVREILSQDVNLNRMMLTEQLRNRGFSKNKVEKVFPYLLTKGVIVTSLTGAGNEKLYKLNDELPNIPVSLDSGISGRSPSSGKIAEEMTDEEIWSALNPQLPDQLFPVSGVVS